MCIRDSSGAVLQVDQKVLNLRYLSRRFIYYCFICHGKSSAYNWFSNIKVRVLKCYLYWQTRKSYIHLLSIPSCKNLYKGNKQSNRVWGATLVNTLANAWLLLQYIFFVKIAMKSHYSDAYNPIAILIRFTWICFVIYSYIYCRLPYTKLLHYFIWVKIVYLQKSRK